MTLIWQHSNQLQLAAKYHSNKLIQQLAAIMVIYTAPTRSCSYQIRERPETSGFFSIAHSYYLNSISPISTMHRNVRASDTAGLNTVSSIKHLPEYGEAFCSCREVQVIRKSLQVS